MSEAPKPNTLTLLAHAHLRLSRQVTDGVASGGHPLKPSHNAVFGQVASGAKRLTTPARTANMTPQAMAEIVDELEALGYVERTPDPSDRRAKLIRLTAKGDTLTGLADSTIRRIEQQISADLGDDGHDQLRTLLSGYCRTGTNRPTQTSSRSTHAATGSELAAQCHLVAMCRHGPTDQLFVPVHLGRIQQRHPCLYGRLHAEVGVAVVITPSIVGETHEAQPLNRNALGCPEWSFAHASRR
jgi:DNA-binding MarR family transcriptional regulator